MSRVVRTRRYRIDRQRPPYLTGGPPEWTVSAYVKSRHEARQTIAQERVRTPGSVFRIRKLSKY